MTSPTGFFVYRIKQASLKKLKTISHIDGLKILLSKLLIIRNMFDLKRIQNSNQIYKIKFCYKSLDK